MDETQRDLIRTLADPVRYALWSRLSEYGPATGSALLRSVPEAEGALTRHLNELRRVGAIEPRDETKRVRTTTWVCVDAPLDWDPGENATDALIVGTFERTSASRQERDRETFRQQKNDGLWSAEWVEAAFTQEWRLSVTAQQLEWVGEKVTAVMDEIKETLAEQGEPVEDEIEPVKIWLYGQPRKTFSEQ